MTTPSDQLQTGPFSESVLEFRAVVELVRNFLSGTLAQPALESLGPGTDLAAIRRQLELAREASEYMLGSPRPRLESLGDPRPILARLAIEGATCSPREILGLVELARAAGNLRLVFRETRLAQLIELAKGLGDFRALVADLEGKILPDGTVDSSASAELRRLRHLMERVRAEVRGTLERLLGRLSRDELVQDEVITLRNDRFVIPVRAEAKRQVEGVIHGSSSSGATVFVEPLETVALNNQLVELQVGETAEIERILADFTARLRGRRGELDAAVAILSEIDLAFAKAAFAREYDCCWPEFVEGRTLGLKRLRHPLLEKTLRARGLTSVPVTLELDEPKTQVVISGPNAGGKTVTLKTLGVAALMAQAGLPVAATEARLPLFARVLADIGDQQSMEADLSTFSAHVRNIQAMVEVVADRDLVLLDELGASTEPGEGVALAVAVLEHFRKRRATTFITTHHARLKAYAAEHREAVNAAMEFDPVTLRPTYRLLIGLPGKSSGIETAERLGLDQSIVARARASLAPAESEASALLASLHEQKARLEKQVENFGRLRQELEAERARLEREFQEERRKRLRELDARLEETLRGLESRWQKELDAVRAQAAAQGRSAAAGKRIERKARELERETREEWNAQVLEALGAPAEHEPATDAPAQVGSRVRVAGLSTPGTVVALVGRDALEVEVGRVRMRVPRREVRTLSPAGLKQETAAAAITPRLQLENSPAEVPAEINVIGATAEEARERVDKYLDEAFVAGRFRLRVVHGLGKGILKKCLHEMFATHPHVEKFYPAPSNEGGAGATVVELKL